MPSYHFPIILGQNAKERIVIIHLTDGREDYQENRVVVVSNRQNDPLFRIPKEAQMIDVGGVRSQFQVDNNLIIKDTSGNIALNETDDFYEYKVMDNVDYGYDGKIEFIYREENKEYQGCLNIIRTEEGHVLKINIDLGSEATQATCFHEDFDSGRCQFINLVDAIKATYIRRNYYSLNKPNDGTLFIQEDDNAYYYKTGNITFHKLPDDSSCGDLTLNEQPETDKEVTRSTQNEQPETDKEVTRSTQNEQPETDKEVTRKTTTYRPFINYLNVSAAGKNKNKNRINSSKDAPWTKEAPYTEKIPNIKILYANPGQNGVGRFCHARWKDNTEYTDLTKTGYDISESANIQRVLRIIYKQIITAAESGLKQQFSDYPEISKRIKATSVLILVPNIYSQEAIDKLLYELNKLNNQKDDISAEMTPASTDEDTEMTTPTPQSLTPPPHIPTSGTTDSGMRYDFRVISESDAAFLGIKQVGSGKNATKSILAIINEEVRDDRQKDTYLIIDSGKGTTDFSIIYYNPGDPKSAISSYKRGGIAGAGAAIDYVFTRIVARQIYKNSDKESKCDEAVFVDRFMKVISLLPPTRQDKAMRLIELAKKKFKDGTIPDLCKCFPKAITDKIMTDSQTIDEIIKMDSDWNEFENKNWNNENTKVEDIDKKEIESVCNMIARKTIEEIFNNTDEHITNRIDFVLMTGRSFLFKPLQSAFEKKLYEKKGIFNVNYSGFWASVCNVVWYRPEFHRMRKGKQTLTNKEKLTNRANLKIDPQTLSLNMKEVSVRFSERDLGYNCNSNLCCLKSLKLINDDKEFEFKQENFWKGFTCNGENGSTTYYIGYKGRSFTVQRDDNNPGDQNEDAKKLENMTIFPSHYEPVEL